MKTTLFVPTQPSICRQRIEKWVEGKRADVAHIWLTEPGIGKAACPLGLGLTLPSEKIASFVRQIVSKYMAYRNADADVH
jgi:hypothetical protein